MKNILVILLLFTFSLNLRAEEVVSSEKFISLGEYFVKTELSSDTREVVLDTIKESQGVKKALIRISNIVHRDNSNCYSTSSNTEVQVGDSFTFVTEEVRGWNNLLKTRWKITVEEIKDTGLRCKIESWPQVK